MGVDNNHKEGDSGQNESLPLCAEYGFVSEASRGQLVLPEHPVDLPEFADFLKKWADRAQSNQGLKAGNTPPSFPQYPDISNEPR